MTVSTGRRRLTGPEDPRHGTMNGYKNYGCRCDACREAHNAYQLRYQTAYNRRIGHKPREEYLAAVAAGCGTESRYKRGCRCDKCRAAATAARKRRRRAARKAAA